MRSWRELPLSWRRSRFCSRLPESPKPVFEPRSCPLAKATVPPPGLRLLSAGGSGGRRRRRRRRISARAERRRPKQAGRGLGRCGAPDTGSHGTQLRTRLQASRPPAAGLRARPRLLGARGRSTIPRCEGSLAHVGLVCFGDDGARRAA
eukprot:303965-Chlamydomonas_euryale.AAC.4